MSVYVRTALVVLLPGALAFSQGPVNPNNPVGPPQQGQFGGPGPQGFVGPPPNAMFSAIDIDGDGVITKTELRRAVVQLRKLDADEDGNITLAEVSPFGGPGGPGPNPAQIVEQLMQHDKNNDGQLTADETPDNVRPMLQEADLDKNAIVTREELTAVVQNMQNQFPGGPGAGPWNVPGGFRGTANRDASSAQMTGRLMRNDKNGDGMLSSDELPANMRAMFQKDDDVNGDGSLDAGELQAVVKRMGDRGRALRGGVDPERNEERGRGDNGRGRNRVRNDN